MAVGPGEFVMVTSDDRALELLRSGLRRRDVAQTVAALRQCDATLANDAWYRTVREYALNRLGQSAREPDSAARSAPGLGSLQQVLQWLLREEFETASRWLRAARFDEALQECHKAARIDGRHAQLAWIRAVAILGDEAPRRSKLVEARRWLTVAATDPALHAQCQLIAKKIDRVQRRIEESQVNGLINRYNGIVRAYDRPTIYQVEAVNMRASLVALKTDVARARKECRAGTPSATSLAELADAISARIADISRRLGM
jgi:hypothetical protein